MPVSVRDTLVMLDMHIAASRSHVGTRINIGEAWTDALNNDIAIMEALRTLLALLAPPPRVNSTNASL